jgi:hypothetical protein
VKWRVLAAWLLAACLTPLSGAADAASSPADLVAEARRSFTLDGKQIPPEIFRDFGDGDLADSGAIWVTIDLKSAIGSNLYFDDITKNGDWIIQKKVRPDASEETAYTYIGATENGLLVALAAYSGGGSGDFITLHILDIAAARGFGAGGDLYDRVNLTNLRSIPLGDRWDGEVTIAKNVVTIVTTRAGPADQSGTRKTMVIEARRP